MNNFPLRPPPRKGGRSKRSTSKSFFQIAPTIDDYSSKPPPCWTTSAYTIETTSARMHLNRQCQHGKSTSTRHRHHKQPNNEEASHHKEPHHNNPYNSQNLEQKGNCSHMPPRTSMANITAHALPSGHGEKMKIGHPTNDPRPFLRQTRKTNSITNPPFTRKAKPSTPNREEVNNIARSQFQWSHKWLPSPIKILYSQQPRGTIAT
jgi:hypothetical protein